MICAFFDFKMNEIYKNYKLKLEEQKENDSFRFLDKISVSGKFIKKHDKTLLNLSSNDYLGISTRDDIKAEFLNLYDKQISIPSARLLCANTEIYSNLEEFLQTKFNKESALLFNSGYHANVGIYSTLAKTGDAVFCDKLNHASIIDGIRLGGADLIPFKHADYNDLEIKLKKYAHKYKNIIIATEALFSMDGDFADICTLVELKEKYGAILIVDEAHSFGVYGNGLGYCAQCGKLQDVDLIMGTFGKAVGSYGAFVVGSKILTDYLINFARSFIFSTVFPQISAAFAHYVLENCIFSSNEFQQKLLTLADYMHNVLKDFKILGSSYIVPIVFGENKNAVNASKKMFENGYYALPIRYPTVAKNSARLRISLNSSMNLDDIDKLCVQIKKLHTAL